MQSGASRRLGGALGSPDCCGLRQTSGELASMSTQSLEWLQTLADATRVRLLSVLQHGEFSVGELCSIVQLPQSTVSRHLKLLADEGWADNRRDGTNQLYSLTREFWSAARQELWEWVLAQTDGTATTIQDEARVRRVLAERSRSEAFFSSAAERWDGLRVELFGAQLDAYILAATLPAGAVVAELGCGSAPLAQLSAPYVRQVIAVDSSSAMLAAARQRLADAGNVRLEQASLTELPIEDRLCDVAWLVMVLPYIDEVAPVIAEAARILKPCAPLVVVDLQPHDRHSYRQEMGHVRMGVSCQEMAGWFRQAGLSEFRYNPLPPDPSAKGPALFAAVGQYSGQQPDPGRQHGRQLGRPQARTGIDER